MANMRQRTRPVIKDTWRGDAGHLVSSRSPGLIIWWIIRLLFVLTTRIVIRTANSIRILLPQCLCIVPLLSREIRSEMLLDEAQRESQ